MKGTLLRKTLGCAIGLVLLVAPTASAAPADSAANCIKPLWCLTDA